MLNALQHPTPRSFSAHIIIKFSEYRNHALHRLSNRTFIYWFRYRPQVSAILFQFCPHNNVVALITGETINFIDDEIIHLIFFTSAKCNRFRKFCAINSLCRLAFIYIHIENFNIVPIGISSAKTFLRFEARILDLIL